jgi:hypothetical protein
LSHQIDYLHRTVRDFLLGAQASVTLKSYTRGPFEINRYLANACATQLSLLASLARKGYYADGVTIQSTNGLFVTMLDDFMHYMKQFEDASRQALVEVMDWAETIICRQLSESVPGDRTGSSAAEANHMWLNWKSSFVSLTIQYDLQIYTSLALKRSKPKIAGFSRGNGTQGRPILDFALRRWTSEPSAILPPNPKLIEMLLELGADPNGMFEQESVWYRFIDYLKSVKLRSWDGVEGDIWRSTVELLIRHGAMRFPLVMTHLESVFGPETSDTFFSLFNTRKSSLPWSKPSNDSSKRSLFSKFRRSR